MKAAGDKYNLKTLTEVMDSAHCQLVSDLCGRPAGGRPQLPELQPAEEDRPGDALIRIRWCCTSAASPAPSPSGSPPPTTSPIDGNDNVVLCERGIRTFETATRFTLDIAAVPVIHKQSLYPVCIDVSHPAGQRDLVPALGEGRRGRRSRLAHDRGAPQPAGGAFRRSRSS